MTTTNVELILASYHKDLEETVYTFKLTIPRWTKLRQKAAELLNRVCIALDIPPLVQRLTLETHITGTEEEIGDFLETRGRHNFHFAMYAPALYKGLWPHFDFTNDLFPRLTGANKVGVSVKVIQDAARLYGRRMNQVFKILTGNQQHEDFWPVEMKG